MVTFLAQTASTTSSSMGIAPLDNVTTLLEQFGFFRVVLPFLLIFALMYAVLMKAKILGDPEKPYVKSINAIISLAIAFFVISSTPVVNLMMTLIPQASFMLVVALFLIMIMTFVVPTEWINGVVGDKKWLAAIAVILVIIFLGIVGSATPDIPVLSGLSQVLMGNVSLPSMSADAVSVIIGILILFGIPAVIIGIIIWSSGKGPG